jgi:hypothetical protein
MYVVTCPGCARPSAVSLAHPDMMACDACGYRGPIPEDAARSLRAAVAMIRGLDARGRQLSAVQRRALHSSGCTVAIVVALFLVLLLPAMGLAVFGAHILEGFCLEPDQAQAP